MCQHAIQNCAGAACCSVWNDKCLKALRDSHEEFILVACVSVYVATELSMTTDEESYRYV